jgi:hypothetical protein
MHEHHFSIFYLLYNPPVVPLTIELPLTANAVQDDNPTLGARVFRYSGLGLCSQFLMLQARDTSHRWLIHATS